MSKESAFSVRSWASVGGTRVEGAFSGGEVMIFSSLITWVPFSVCCAPLAAGPVLLCSGLLGGEVDSQQQTIHTMTLVESNMHSGIVLRLQVLVLYLSVSFLCHFIILIHYIYFTTS